MNGMMLIIFPYRRWFW